ncbi:MOSC domain-containing protein [Aggregatimonas sangjinii]|uniref:MOSC domain-containing protein n=1 Tax=Aggregatimonas sangjinii TaxID=2583587 RepID=A0A5B7SZ22_9FLAO|nr:MOSC N-terminal beta barrel domain-containing protein [Aggregatimonas sangjinii]QCX02191.1 MOSC domain-containing protein [Aggregatimonas sangjinii]
MATPIVSEIYHYPLKSSKGVSMPTAEVRLTGLRNDRTISVIDGKNKVVTGREYPELIHLITKIEKGQLYVKTPSSEIFNIALPSSQSTIEVKLFRNRVLGTLFDAAASEFISTYLKGNFQLIHLGADFRNLAKERGGRNGERTGFADSAPVHLINRSTLNYLNLNLSDKVTSKNFRPNIVIDGFEAFEEDHWKAVHIGGCRFRVQEMTKRCVFTTIDPETAQKDAEVEPLATLAKLRSMQQLPATFGIGLVPKSEGVIAVGDALIVEKVAEN